MTGMVIYWKFWKLHMMLISLQSLLHSPRARTPLFTRSLIETGTASLFRPECRTPQQMKMANGFCRYMELAGGILIR